MQGMWSRNTAANAIQFSGALSNLFNQLLFTAESDANHNLVGGEIINYGREKALSTNKACAALNFKTKTTHCEGGVCVGGV